MKKATITLALGEIGEFDFDVDIVKYNNFLNSSSQKNKVQAVQNFLVTCVQEPAKKDELAKAFRNHPGLALQLLDSVLEAYAPDVAVTVKTLKTEHTE